MVSKSGRSENPKRKKVSRACDSCRKRKIKCTGTQPCMNCQVYQSVCRFTDKKVTPQPLRLCKEKENVSVNSVESILKPNPLDRSSENSFPTPENPDIKTEIYSQSLYQADLSQSSELNLFNQEDKEFENGLYEADVEKLPSFKEYKETLEKLEAIPVKNKLINNMIEETQEKLLQLTVNWQPKINLEKLPSLLKALDPIDASKSVETQLMINKYRSTLHLTRYSQWSFNSRNKRVGSSSTDINKNCTAHSRMALNTKENGYLNSLPLIDEIFGLYHACEALSLRGIAYLTQKYSVLRPEGSSNVQIIRANVFLLLRIFDLCWLHMNEDRSSMANPLDSYLQKNKKHTNMDFGASPSNSNISVVSAASSPGPNNMSNKAMVSTILRTLPSYFSEYLSPDTVLKLLNTVNSDLKMFKLLLNICGEHTHKIEAFAQWLGPPNKQSVDAHDLERYRRLISVHELLLTLCYTYYNSTMYYLYHIDTLEYLELLLDMLEYGEWAHEIYGFDRILNIAINCALKAGLSRWEYYVGFDEATAERRRKVWWKLYMYDKKMMIKDSYLTAIDDSKMNCLLPTEFRDLGYVDHKDFIKTMHLISRSEKFDNLPVESLLFYAKCATYQVASHYYSEVLYNEKYTSIRNAAKPDEMRLRLISELSARMGLATLRLDKIKEQCGKLFEIAENKNDPKFVNVSDKAKREAISFVFEYSVVCCLFIRFTMSLGSRLAVFPKPTFLKDRITKWSRLAYDNWVQLNKSMLKMEGGYDLWNNLENYLVLFLLVITWMYDECAYIQHEDIIDIINIFERLSSLKDLFMSGTDPSRPTTNKFFSTLFSLFSVLSRIVLTDYVGFDRMNCEAISEIFGEDGDRIIELVRIIFDANSYCYQLILRPIEESEFHTSIKTMLKSDYNIEDTAEHTCNSTKKASSLPRSVSEQILKPAKYQDFSETRSEASKNDISRLLQTNGMGNMHVPNFQQSDDSTDLNYTVGNNVYPIQSDQREDSPQQIGYIDKRLFQPLDLGILEEFFSTTNFNDLGSL